MAGTPLSASPDGSWERRSVAWTMWGVGMKKRSFLPNRHQPTAKERIRGGEGGIRTREALGLNDFQSCALDRAMRPLRERGVLYHAGVDSSN